MSHRPQRARRIEVRETHEPETPQNWPEGHVSVALTRDEIGECIEVTIHGVKHYLHSTTARELANMLTSRLDEWNTTMRGKPGHQEV
jgi:hypothetical protein